MGSFETFSKRRLAQERAGAPDVFAYDQLPNPFRAQVVHIWKDLIGEWTDLVRFKEQGDVNRAWTEIRDILARERGCFYLFNPHCNQCEDCFGFMLNGDVDGCLDLIEITFRWIDRVTRETCNAPSQCDDAIVELNHRFHEHAIGYEYTGGKLVRVDSQYLHAEVIKPALSLLSRPGYEGANEEFRKAHEHYRHSRFKEALVAAENAFESTLKSVCLAKNYHLPANATARLCLKTVT